MKIIFGTTNNRKVEDLNNIIRSLDIDVEVLSMTDIGWNLGEIDENGDTLEANSLIKAMAIHEFCVLKGISYPVITDDAGLYVDCLGDEPGIYTARYADDELELDSTLPKYQCVVKLLRKIENEKNRGAEYRCVVTCVLPDGSYFQEVGRSRGMIAEDIIGELKKPYFYSVFVLSEYDKVFSSLTPQELEHTYRYEALKKMLMKVNDK